eukprot:gnl/TRDRNA2_/TRDRNA2_177500_c5_seq1.p1 gnl/TRDRNA2_/TRDRNA2_177500_c5~~gnl/TRDRNA2_/TRDRNA2_177500_c5_seq1.p1  ORF type:complete len:692 (+),score=-10.59 gnl/TRDRNA2_/TRDRNA2_177500_c5_seq1:44-2119(+)
MSSQTHVRSQLDPHSPEFKPTNQTLDSTGSSRPTDSEEINEHSTNSEELKNGKSSHLAPWVRGIVGRASLRSSPLPTPRELKQTEMLSSGDETIISLPEPRVPKPESLTERESVPGKEDLQRTLAHVLETKFSTHKCLQFHLNRVWFLRLLIRNNFIQENIGQQVLFQIDINEEQTTNLLENDRKLHPQDSESIFYSALTAQNLEFEKCSEPLVKISVLLFGVAGSGKTETINNILRVKKNTKSYYTATTKIEIIKGEAFGVEWTFIDSPGLYPSASEKAVNEDLLRNIKAAISTHSPDLFLYCDRMDYVRRDKADLSILKSICEILSSDVLLQSLVILTHSGSPPPEGTHGQLGFEAYSQQRQEIIRYLHCQASREGRLKPMICPVENHSSCKKNSNGESVLPDGTPWREHLITMMAGYKALLEYDKILGVTGQSKHSTQDQILTMYGLGGSKMPPVNYLIEQLMAPHPPREVPEDEKQIVSIRDIAKMDGDIASKKEAMIRRKDFISHKAEEARHARENTHSEVALLAREPHLPPSFDSLETIIHRFLYLENQNGWIIQPQFAHPNKILDHDDGFEGFAIERSGVMRPPHTYVGGLPFYCSAIVKQASDKKIQVLQGDLQLTTGLDVLPTVGKIFETTKLTSGLNIISLAAQTRGNDVLYVLGAETKTKKKKKNKNKKKTPIKKKRAIR